MHVSRQFRQLSTHLLCFQGNHLEIASGLPAGARSQPMGEFHHMECWETRPETIPISQPNQSEEGPLPLHIASKWRFQPISADEIFFRDVLMNCLGESFLWCGYKQDPERFLHAWGVQGEINRCSKIVSQCKCKSLFTKPWYDLSGVPAATAKAKDPSSALQRRLPPSRYLC